MRADAARFDSTPVRACAAAACPLGAFLPPARRSTPGVIEPSMRRIFLTCAGLPCAASMLIVSYAEKQQEVALESLSNYKLEPQPDLYDDPDLKLITGRSP